MRAGLPGHPRAVSRECSGLDSSSSACSSSCDVNSMSTTSGHRAAIASTRHSVSHLLPRCDAVRACGRAETSPCIASTSDWLGLGTTMCSILKPAATRDVTVRRSRVSRASTHVAAGASAHRRGLEASRASHSLIARLLGFTLAAYTPVPVARRKRLLLAPGATAPPLREQDPASASPAARRSSALLS
jgi:hypothetical protein